MDMDTYNLAFAQGLAYVWGRNDQRRVSEGPGPDVDSVAFATDWAELCARNASRPDLSGAFKNFRDHGRVQGGPDSGKVDFTAYYEGRGM